MNPRTKKKIRLFRELLENNDPFDPPHLVHQLIGLEKAYPVNGKMKQKKEKR